MRGVDVQDLAGGRPEHRDEVGRGVEHVGQPFGRLPGLDLGGDVLERDDRAVHGHVVAHRRASVGNDLHAQPDGSARRGLEGGRGRISPRRPGHRSPCCRARRDGPPGPGRATRDRCGGRPAARAGPGRRSSGRWSGPDHRAPRCRSARRRRATGTGRWPRRPSRSPRRRRGCAPARPRPRGRGRRCGSPR